MTTTTIPVKNGNDFDSAAIRKAKVSSDKCVFSCPGLTIILRLDAIRDGVSALQDDDPPDEIRFVKDDDTWDV